MRHKNLHIFFALFLFIASPILGTAQDCSRLPKPDTDHSGIVRFQLTPTLCDCNKVYSLLAEAGPENYRANLTYAASTWFGLRYKLTGEYLTQKHRYRFADSSKKEWIHQVAIGGATEFAYSCGWFQGIELAADYSHAYGKELSDALCSETELEREISGSDAYNVRVGTTFCTPCGGLLNTWIGYDYVRYNKDLRGKKTVDGFGGGFLLDQPIRSYLGVVLVADFKRPYHFYEAQINWEDCACGGNWKTGVFTSYTDGKDGLNNDYKIGGQLTYSFGCDNSCCDPCKKDTLSRWASRPAVYRPLTLAIADQSRLDCIPPQITGTPPTSLDYSISVTITPFDFSPFFTGSDLTFTGQNLPPGLTVDPVTGIMSGTTTDVEANYATVITATNECGSTSLDVTIRVFGR